MREIKKEYLIIGVFIVGFFVMNLLCPYVADDYGYKVHVGTHQPINTLFDLISSQIDQYLRTNGRVTAHFFVQLFMQFNKIVFDLINSIVTVFYFYLILVMSSTKKEKFIQYFFSSFLLFLAFVPNIGQTVLWLTGSINYLWNTVICFLFISFYLHQLDNDGSCSNIKLIGISILGFFAGAANENTSIATIFTVICFTFWIYLKKRKIIYTEYLPIIMSVLGLCFMVFAPGNSIRLSNALAGSAEGSGILSMINRIWPYTIQFLKTDHLWILALSSLLIIGILFAKKDYNSGCKSLIFYLASLCSNYAMIATPFYPRRAMFGGVSFMLISFMIAINALNIKKKIIAIIAVFIFVINIPLTYDALIDYAYTSYRWHIREAEIYKQIELGNKNISNLEWIGSEYKINPFYGLEDLRDDPNFWVNRAACRYYNIESITLK